VQPSGPASLFVGFPVAVPLAVQVPCSAVKLKVTWLPDTVPFVMSKVPASFSYPVGAAQFTVPFVCPDTNVACCASVSTPPP
jgi:hypothetical protein